MKLALLIVQLFTMSIIAIWLLFIGKINMPVIVTISTRVMLIYTCVVLISLLFVADKQFNKKGNRFAKGVD